MLKINGNAGSQQHLQTWLDKAEFMMDFAETAKQRFENGSLETKRQILSLLGSNFLLTDGKLTIEVQKPILLMKEIEKECSVEVVRLEPAENLDIRTLNREYRVNSVTWRGKWDSNL